MSDVANEVAVLLPCPFCGGGAHEHQDREALDYGVHCDTCGVSIEQYNDQAFANEVWNGRPATSEEATLARMLADEQAAHAETRQVVAHHRQAATRWTNHAGVLTEQLTEALAILDEVSRVRNLWPAQQLRVLKIRAAISKLYQGDEATTTNGQQGEEGADATADAG